MNATQVEMLISELVRPELVPLYLNNVFFHDSVQRLAHSLPLWVDALAAQAKAQESEQQARMIELMRGQLNDLTLCSPWPHNPE